MQAVTLVCKLADNIIGDGPFIGVDRGALSLARAGKEMLMAIGDFDSVDVNELALIKEKCSNIVLLEREKDETDSEEAIKYALKLFDKVILQGATNGRSDHYLGNLMLVYRYAGKVEILDEHNHIRYLGVGDYKIFKRHKYLSFLTFNECEISLNGVKYPTDHYHLHLGDVIGVSNEITNDLAEISIHDGYAICMECDD